MSRPCPLERCGADLDDQREICRACDGRLRGQLRAIPELLEELDTSLARIGSTWREPGGVPGTAGGRCRPGCDHGADDPSCVEGVSLCMSDAASEAAMQLRVCLHGWVRVWDEQTPLPVGRIEGPRCLDMLRFLCRHESCQAVADARHAAIERRLRDRGMSTAARQALLLASQPLAGRPWAPDLAREILEAVRAADRAVDRPPESVLIGTCDACHLAVYGHAESLVVTCRCGQRYDARGLHAAALNASGDDATAPASVIARALLDPLTRAPIVTAARIRGWRYRGSLAVAGVDPDGRPLYRVADVARLARDGAVPDVEGPLCRVAVTSSCPHESCRVIRAGDGGQRHLPDHSLTA